MNYSVLDLETLHERKEVYKLYRSTVLEKNKDELVEEALKVHKKFESSFPGVNSTASTTAAEKNKYKIHDGYRYYNVFSLAAPSPLFILVYNCLVAAIRDFVPTKQLYLQAWLNCQDYSEVLSWHSHEGYLYHGYISIDPQDSITEFEAYEIDNKPGQIYIGKAFLPHRVVNRSDYTNKRITIGFDIIEPMDCSISNSGFIPLVM